MMTKDSAMNPTTVHTPSDRELVVTRVFNAPRELVFEAWTNPKHIPHWYGPSEMTMTHCESDLRVGGRYRFVLTDKDGNDYGFGGVYQEVVRPEKLVATDGFEGMPGREALVTIFFEERDGKTLLTSTMVYQSAEDLKTHIENGMESGMRETYERLDDYLETLAR